MRMDEAAVNKLLLELQNTRAELKKSIRDSESRILEELETKIKKLEVENTSLKEEIKNYEIKSKKKNIIVFGLNKELVYNVSKLCQDLNQVLGTNISERDISDVYLLGKSENSPIKIEFVSFLRKKPVLVNLKKLKGTKIGISDDLTKDQQEDLRKLRNYLKIIRKQQPDQSSYIRGFKLYIKYVGYTAKQLDEGEYVILDRRPNSAPATPTVNRDLDEVFEDTVQHNNKDKTEEDVQIHQQQRENRVKKNEGNKIITNHKESTYNSTSNQETPKNISSKKPLTKTKTSSLSDANRIKTRSKN